MINNLKNHQTLPISFKHFLWPNNKTDGVFENLLEKLIPLDKTDVLGCLESNYTCLNALKSKLSIKIPSVKEKLNSYLYLLGQSTKINERTYLNDCWHLNTELCEELSSFKEFLSEHITSNIVAAAVS